MPADYWAGVTDPRDRAALAGSVVFGDIEADDAYDPTGAPDPAQVAQRLQELRTELDAATPAWPELDDDARAVAVEAMRRLIEWLRRQGSLR